MKTLLEYIVDNEKKYGFRVKIAGDLGENCIKSMQHVLARWKLEAISEPKHLPIAEEHTGFAHLKNTDISIIDLVVNYPATPHEIQAAVHESTQIPLSHIMVVTPTQEVLAAPIVADSDSPVLTHDFPEQKAPQLLADLANALKSKTIEHQFAVKPEKGKTTNEIPQYTTSAIGTKKTKLPERPRTGRN